MDQLVRWTCDCLRLYTSRNALQLEYQMGSPTSFVLDDDMEERVQHLADSRKQTSQAIICEAVAQYVAREERRAALCRDVLQAWETFQRTGVHATAEDVDRWLVNWGTEDEAPAPACHA
ncbi:CopG family ribbon-helix-helix protein [Loktanella atrilutea]|nr:CopG family ribbon-helix-helix protein [Loktanella atrilutea]